MSRGSFQVTVRAGSLLGLPVLVGVGVLSQSALNAQVGPDATRKSAPGKPAGVQLGQQSPVTEYVKVRPSDKWFGGAVRLTSRPDGPDLSTVKLTSSAFASGPRQIELRLRHGPGGL